MLRHNKKRNSFVVYEQLVSLTTRLAAQGNKKEASMVVEIIKEYYNPNTEIGKEFKIIDAVLSSKGHKKEVASDIVAESLVESKKLSQKKLDKEKTKLIEKINRSLSKTLFNIPIRDYKIAASVQILMNEARSQNADTTPVERAKVKNLLVERLSRSNKKSEKVQVDNLTLAVLVSKFNKRYSQVMNEDQRDVLSTWTTFLIDSDRSKAQNALNQKVDKLKLSLSLLMDSKIHNKTEHGPLLKEAYSNLVNRPIDVNETVVYEVMRYFDLVEDLNNYAQEKEV